MSLPNVNITLGNGALGSSLQTSDGITGMVLTGADEGSILAGTPFLVTSLADAATQGLSSTGNPFAYKHVEEFYNEVANLGGNTADLYLMLVSTTMKVSDIADGTNANGAIKLLNFAGGIIRVLGIITDDTQVYGASPLPTLVTTAGINADCYDAANKLQLLGQTFFAQQKPFRGIVGGTSFTGTATTLTDMTTETYNRVSILIGDTLSGAGAAVGLMLGRVSSIPVQRKISRVRDGAVSSTTAYIGAVTADQYADTETLFDKAFITFRSFPNKSGFFFSGDATCTATTDDYQFLSRGRVMDKAQILAYSTFVQEVDDEVPVDASGNIDAGYAKWLQQQVINQVNLSMTADKEISAVSCFVDPAQNVLSTSTVSVVLKVTPVGYASDIEILLSFSNPAIA